MNLRRRRNRLYLHPYFYLCQYIDFKHDKSLRNSQVDIFLLAKLGMANYIELTLKGCIFCCTNQNQRMSRLSPSLFVFTEK